MKQKTQIPLVFVALPFAYQDGMDKYYGIMRFLREKGIDWELRVQREMFDKDEFRRCISETVSGVICGVTSGRFGIEREDTDLSMECLEVCRRRNIPLVGLDWSLEKLRSRNLRRCSFLNIDSEYEDASLVYTGLESRHAGEGVGLYNTVLTEDEYKELYRAQQEALFRTGDVRI